MATSRSEPDVDVTLPDEEVEVSLPESATRAEAAAIAAAVGAHLRDCRARAAAAESEEAATDVDGWHLASRLETVGRPPRRLPAATPASAWSASGRIRQF